MCLRNMVLCACTAVTLAVPALGAEPQNMIGRQSQNEGILLLPAPPKVKINGDLAEWDWSGRFRVFADIDLRSRYSVEAAAMWDAENLYLAAKWKDPTPMYSTVDPDYLVNEGWKSDSWQLRIRTDKISHVTLWHFAPKKMPVCHIQYGQSMTKPFGGPGTFWVGKAGGTALGRGIEMAYRKTGDDAFVQEVRLPWEVICDKKPDWKAGDTFQLGNEFLWGDPSGRTWPVHRYADNMQPGQTSREFYWTAWNKWGDATLLAKGDVPVREYVPESFKIEGTVPVRVAIPADATRFTIVIEDQNGGRIRTLAGGCDPLVYSVGLEDEVRTVEVKWDCLDDKGKLIKPGTFKVRGLTHKGLGAEYEMCFYNPGTPPWRVKDGSGAWGADHAAPNNVAAAADWMIVTWPGAEGGSGIIGLDPSGRKRWGDRRGIGKLAADATYVYAFVSGWYVEDTLCRFAAKDGSYQPFVSGERPRPFDLPLEQIFGGNPPGQVVGMAVHKNGLALAMSGGVLAILDSSSAELKQRIAVRAIEDVAYDKDGRLYVLADGRLNLLAPDDRALKPIIAGTLERPVAITTDNDGNILVADVGPDSQVKAFSPRGGEPIYTCGKKGGRPIRGAFDKQAMVQMSSVAADSKGNVWVVENWNYPRRVSVWGKDGKLVRDYIGNTGYAGTSCYLHDTNPEFAYCGPVEFKLNKEDRTWEITQVMWVPDRDKGECFEIPTGSHINPQRFAGNASGKTREYLYAHDIRDAGGQVVYMQRNGGWQPVAAICLVAHISGRIDHYGVVRENPAGEMAGLNCYDGCYWNDTNKDGKVQRNECIIIPSKNPGELGKRGEAAIKLQNGWGGRIGPDLSIYTDGITRHKPLRFTDDGAPVYGPEGAKPVGVGDSGDIVPMPGEDRLIVLSWVGYADSTRLTGINPERGTIDWYYPNLYPGVHGSHRAPMPRPGLLIGTIKTMGSAYVNDHAGTVFAMRGNLGQDFFMTTDGIYVDAMFRDARLPAEALPEKEESLIGMPMETFSIGGEPFNGWFGKQADGKIRMTTGMAREACMILEVKGLDTIRRFSAGTVSVDLPTIVKADGENTDRAKVAAEPKTHIIKKLKGVPNLDGVLGEWGDHAQIRIKREGQPEQATAWLAYDEANLHIAFRVSDATPWLNEGKDYTRLFKTGDAVDLQLSTVAAAKPHRDPKPGDVRIVFSQLNGKPVAVLMKPIDNTSPAEKTVKFTSPIGTRIFQRIEVIADARVAVRKGSDTYVLEASVPLKTIGLTPKPGVTIRGDLGFISSDARGMINTARTYWCNQHTNLVNDLPHEAWLYPDKWGEMTFE